jgi:putative spermidine/putrescine transport system permease protein
MRSERWRIALMFAPTMIVIGVLFGGGLAYGLLQSLGWQPLIGNRQLTLRAYANILTSERYAAPFWAGLLLSLWVSLASTALSAVLAVGAALLLRRSFWGKRLSVFLLQFNLPIPHVVAAIGILFVLSQSGLLSRLGTQLGLYDAPSDFPVLVRDPYGIGIILSYVWKEVPFIGVIVLAVLQSVGQDYEDSARMLGANAWQRFRYVTLPLIAPSLVSTSTLVFAFTFGAYEVPGILGVRHPRALPVLALRFFLNADLNSRAEAMALGVIITATVTALVAGYTWLVRQRGFREGTE